MASEEVDRVFSALSFLSEAECRQQVWNGFAFLVVDRSGQVLAANRPAEELFGYIGGEMRRHLLEDLLPSEDRDTHPELRKSYFDDPGLRPMNAGRIVSAVRKNGDIMQVSVGLYSFFRGDEQFAVALVQRVESRHANPAQ